MSWPHTKTTSVRHEGLLGTHSRARSGALASAGLTRVSWNEASSSMSLVDMKLGVVDCSLRTSWCSSENCAVQLLLTER